MNLSISGQHLTVTDALRVRIEGKIRRLIRHVDQIEHMHVVLTVEKRYHRAEGKASIAGQPILFADASDEDMYNAIDQLMHKLDRLLVKQKEKSKTIPRS